MDLTEKRKSQTSIENFGITSEFRFGSSSSQTSQTSGDFCRICHESDAINPLLTPCLCSGSLRYVHQSCLQQWLTASETNSCELCKFPFIMQSKIKPFCEWRSLEMSGVERRRLFCAVLFHFAAALCVIWSLCVLIERSADEVRSGKWGWPFWTKLVVVTVGMTGGIVFMYIQCKQYLNLCSRWRARNRILLIQNAPEKTIPIHPVLQQFHDPTSSSLRRNPSSIMVTTAPLNTVSHQDQPAFNPTQQVQQHSQTVANIENNSLELDDDDSRVSSKHHSNEGSMNNIYDKTSTSPTMRIPGTASSSRQRHDNDVIDRESFQLNQQPKFVWHGMFNENNDILNDRLYPKMMEPSRHSILLLPPSASTSQRSANVDVPTESFYTKRRYSDTKLFCNSDNLHESKIGDTKLPFNLALSTNSSSINTAKDMSNLDDSLKSNHGHEQQQQPTTMSDLKKKSLPNIEFCSNFP